MDIDDTVKEVHGYQKQGSGYGYSGVRGLNALIGIVSTATSAPVIIASRLRKGATGSARGAGKFVGDALAAVARLRTPTAAGLVLLRADSASYGHLPSGIFTANAAWLALATIAFNLSRAIGSLAGTELGKARSATIRRKLINLPAPYRTGIRLPYWAVA